ncbi:hypothetical protein TruAng_008747 [Truncatella angustata]|nr:hypothetical protein TruAng_008747 [Truncatella angustata]
MAISRFTNNSHRLSNPNIIYINDDSSGESSDEDYIATCHTTRKSIPNVELEFGGSNSINAYAASVSLASDNADAIITATRFEVPNDLSNIPNATTSFNKDALSTETYEPVICSRNNSVSSSDIFTFEDTYNELQTLK